MVLCLPVLINGQDTLSVQFNDSLLLAEVDSVPLRTKEEIFLPVESFLDTSKVINYWQISRYTGEMLRSTPDTVMTDYFNRTNPEGAGTSVAYLGNLGLPMESRIFFDRADRSEFMFLDPYWHYTQAPDKFHFVNTRIPQTRVSYQRAGSRQNMEERFAALMSINIGKNFNFGGNIDYLYARGLYNSQAAKHFELVFFSSYVTDRHQLHAYVNTSSRTNGENGGVENPGWITRPDTMSENSVQSKDIPVNITNTWNRLKGKEYYLNYRYNLGFERTTNQKDEEGKPVKQFIPVSSILYTFNYKDHQKRFYSKNSTDVNEYFDYVNYLPNLKTSDVNDSTSYYSVNNTLGLSLREGFSEWAKFDLTAFVSHDIRKYSLIEADESYDSFQTRLGFTNQNSTYVGGELIKKTGKVLTYRANGRFGIAGYNVGNFDVAGEIQTNIPFLNQITSLKVNAYIKNLSPTFYENHYHSKYIWWDNDFSNVQKVFVGGEINFPLTRTNISLGVENVTDYIYFGSDGKPAQADDNIQVLAATLKQNFKFGLLHWDNQIVYQTSSDQDIIPLPDIAAYSSLYLDFKVAKVLTIQLGANAHYWTEYYAPGYNPATQQFTVQDQSDRVKVGNYPLINGFVNCHLKQTRFFIEYYNASSLFINPTEYFSLRNYPVNPSMLKMGLSIDFVN